MIVDITVGWVKQLKLQSEAINDGIRYKDDNKRARIDLRMLSPKEVDALGALAETAKGISGGYKGIIQAIETFKLMKADPSGQPVTDLKALVTALTEHFLKSAPHRWVFATELTHRMPYYVQQISYTPPKRYDGFTSPAFVTMTTKANGESETASWYDKDVDGKRTVPRLLALRGLRTEDPQLVAAYEDEMLLWQELQSKVGQQYSATGTAYIVSTSWYSSGNTIAMDREGKSAKVVIDDGSEQSEGRRRSNADESKTCDPTFWLKAVDPSYAGRATTGKYGNSRHVEDDDPIFSAAVAALPTHPWVNIFDLVQHQFLSIHVNDLDPYEFDKTLGEKLILPVDSLDILTALVRGSGEMMEDIVSGKTGGTIVIATGPPGVGKTLTAEVFSEIMEKPLYTVQCSQLGLDPAALEKELGIVLARASRWKAILLIDEADVYVRERGADILQNAMVGVWLRVLEYYRGVLFLTSNRSTMIDDAVMSRATAWVRYELPTPTELARIWEVLGAQYEMPMDSALIAQLVERWPKATGRNVKNLIKLVKQLAKAEVPRTGVALFEMAAKFLAIQEPEPTGWVLCNLDTDGDGNCPEHPSGCPTGPSNRVLIKRPPDLSRMRRA